MVVNFKEIGSAAWMKVESKQKSEVHQGQVFFRQVNGKREQRELNSSARRDYSNKGPTETKPGVGLINKEKGSSGLNSMEVLAALRICCWGRLLGGGTSGSGLKERTWRLENGKPGILILTG